jgi:hypothetical protein
MLATRETIKNNMHIFMQASNQEIDTWLCHLGPEQRDLPPAKPFGHLIIGKKEDLIMGCHHVHC